MYDIEAILNNLANQIPTWLLFLIIAACLAVLSKSADKMIDGAVALAQRTRLPKIVIGATTISLGTTHGTRDGGIGIGPPGATIPACPWATGWARSSATRLLFSG